MIRKTLQFMCVMGINATVAIAAQTQQYSADMVTHASGQTISGKIYASGDKLRYEMPQAITISRLDRQTSYVLMPSEKMYMEQKIDPAAAAKAGMNTQGELERVPMGKEMVDGRMTDKFKISYADANGPMTVYQWMDAQGLPAKVESQDGSWGVEYRNVKHGQQSEQLFEVPADYQKFAMPVIPGMNPGANLEGGSLDVQKLLQDAQQQVEGTDATGNQ